METLSNLYMGFQAASSGDALLFCLIGVTVGTFVGVLPGVGALAAISIALPLTFYLDPTAALIMLSGIFYGAQYGGSTSSILLNLPGTPTNAVTCLDGYPMTQQGKAGIALFVTTIASFIGGSVAIILLIAFAPSLANFAIGFSSPEYFSIVVLGLVAAATLSSGSPIKGLAMVVLGLILGLVGVDISWGQFRFTFGFIQLSDGINLVAVAMGLFGFGAILNSMGNGSPPQIKQHISLRSMIPSRTELRMSWKPVIRGTTIGSMAGILPGTGPTIASFLAYAVEKKVARDPARFGSGAIEGVVAPEAANNAAVQAGFIPTLTLGIPGDGVMAVLLGALMIHGISPGPQFIESQPTMFWALVASFWIGNVVLLILNLPLIGIWVRVLRIPYHLLYPAMLFFICVGVYSVNNSTFDIFVTIGFGCLGYFMIVYNYPAAPLLLGFVLGPLIEEHLRRSLLYSRGNFAILFESPISASMLIFALLIMLASTPFVSSGARRIFEWATRRADGI